MFTHEEARKFLNQLFKQVFEAGDTESIKKFYHEDIIGHFHNETFGMKEVVERVRLLNEMFVGKWRAKILDHHVIDNLIIFNCKQTWLSPKDNRFCECVVTGTYRIANRKITELWLMMDGEPMPYSEVNKQIARFHDQFEYTLAGKKSFFAYLDDYEYFYQQQRVELSEREQEVLFYYMRGYTAKEIAKQMHLSHRTIENHLSNIMAKYGCNSKSQLRMVLFPDE